MGFFDDMAKKVGSVANEAGSKAKDAASIAKQAPKKEKWQDYSVRWDKKCTMNTEIVFLTTSKKQPPKQMI